MDRQYITIPWSMVQHKIKSKVNLSKQAVFGRQIACFPQEPKQKNRTKHYELVRMYK